MKKYLRLFYFLSLLFLAIYLVKADMLHVPDVKSIALLIGSIVLLFMGFLADALAWYVFLCFANIRVSYSDAVVSSGMSIFGKYIPGKLWIVLGKAGYIADKKNMPPEVVSIHALKCQFISLWIASIFSSLLFIWEDSLLFYIIPMVVFFILLSLLIFSNAFQKLFMYVLKVLFNKSLTLPLLSWKDMVAVVPFYILNWLFWSFSFYFFLYALGSDVPFYVAFAFALAAIVGIIALFSPGGLGVREGIIALILVGAGLTHANATSAAISSRLWFLSGEVFIFLFALILKYADGKRD